MDNRGNDREHHHDRDGVEAVGKAAADREGRVHRAGHAASLLGGCRGFLHADGYAGFNALFADDPEQVARRNVHMPMGRFGRPEEVAATVAYLASDDAGYVTASAFPLDGGITAAYTIPG